jgi:hypothetical protein
MKKLFTCFLGIALFLLLVGCTANTTGKVSALPEIVHEEDIVMEEKYVPKQTQELEEDLPGKVVESPEDNIEISKDEYLTGAMCEGVSLGFKKCEKFDDGSIKLTIFNGLAQLDGMYFRLAYLESESYEFDDRFVEAKEFVDYELTSEELAQVTNLELLPAILVDGELKVCINKKIFLNPKNSCKQS